MAMTDAELAAGSPSGTELEEHLLAPGGEVRETHISWVFLGAGEVFKVKKPVSLGFLDFGTLEKRHEACEAEVALNRRLAPEVYRGVVPITRGTDGRLRFGGSGEPLEWAVHMSRLADADRADELLERGELGADDLRRLARHLAAFHAAARSDAEVARFGSPEAIAANVAENFEQTRGRVERLVDPAQAAEIEGWQLDFLERHRADFEERAALGRVRDGHGDLRLEHVYLPGPSREPTILDCIEFNDRFRYADVCADVAFLAMDLAWHDAPVAAEGFLAAYAREADDYDLYPLVDFYESYRAYVRGKVAMLTAADPGISLETRRRAEAEARRYFLLALASERRPLRPPRVVAVGGLIASGKSTMADALGWELGTPVVDADRTRKSLLGVEPEERVLEPAWQGAYDPEMTARTYTELFRRADVVLGTGRSVILDASFRSREHRERARQLAAWRGAPFHFVECRADWELCRERLRKRERAGGVSDGRLAIFDEFAARWQPAGELSLEEHVVLDTSRPLEESMAVLRRLTT